MRLKRGDVTTQKIKNTVDLLKINLPSVFFSKCYNQNNYSFLREVKNTEIGHLFEHILLEYLSIIKRKNGITNHIHNGVTSWNWKGEKRGTFHITIDSGEDDYFYFREALEESLVLTLKILNSNKDMDINGFRISPSPQEMHSQLQLEED